MSVSGPRNCTIWSVSGPNIIVAPFLPFLGPEIAVFGLFLGPEIAPFSQFLAPEF